VTTPAAKPEVAPVERKVSLPEATERRMPEPARSDTEPKAKDVEVEKPPKPTLRPILLPEVIAEREIRDVLAGEAEKLSAAQREAVTSELIRAQRDLGLEPLFVLAIITQESRFKPRAVGPAGSIGLMQLRPFVAKDVARRHGLRFGGRATLFDPGANVRLGTIFLSELIDRFGDPSHAIAAYNAGPTRVGRLLDRGRRPPQRFVNKVRAHYETLRERYSIEATGWGG
jgi:soluble lytic murein transglycosylase-like protein